MGIFPIKFRVIEEDGSYPDGPFGLAEEKPGVWSVRLYSSTTRAGKTEVHTGRYIPLPSPQFCGTVEDVRQSFKVLAESTTDKNRKLFLVEKLPAAPAEETKNE